MKQISSVVVIAVLLASLRLFVLSETSSAALRETGQIQDGKVVPKSGASLPQNPVAVEAKRRLDANTGKPWKVEWNPKTGTVEEISGESDRSFGDSPKAAATAFLQEYGALFTGQDSTGDGPLSEFRYERMSNKDPRRTTVTFLQHYEGIPVLGGVVVYVAESGRVLGARSSAIHISNLSTTPTIGVEAAIELLRQRVAPTPLSASPGMNQGLRVHGLWGRRPRLVYMIHAVAIGKCGPYTAYLDAHSGEVVSLRKDYSDGSRECEPYRVLDAQPVSPTTPVESEGETPDETIDSSESVIVPPPRGEVYVNPRRPRDSGESQIFVPKYIDPYRPRIERSSPTRPRGDPHDTTRTRSQPNNQATYPRGRKSSSPATTSFIFVDHSLSDRDWDLDGYEQWCYLDWTVETTEPSIQVQVDIFGKDEWGGVDFLRQSEWKTGMCQQKWDKSRL